MSPDETIRILVADEDAAHAEAVAEAVDGDGRETVTVTGGQSARELVEREPWDVVISDLDLDGSRGDALLRLVRARDPGVEVILVTTADPDPDLLHEVMHEGVGDFLAKPVDLEELRFRVDRSVERRRLRRRNQELSLELERRFGFAGIIGNTDRMLRIFETLKRIAPTNASVLIGGESGTGKELIARAIHQNSRRSERKFVPLNCASLGEGVLESELFGHERGAFTGAVSARKGRFEFADGGTLFLDEVGEMPLTTQVKLLRVLEDGEVVRVGANEGRTVDVRLIAATNKDLEQEVRAGNFREDLYFRLRVVTIEMPALRERRADIPLMAEAFAADFARAHAKEVRGIAPAAMAVLVEHEWPGNVRELKNCVENMVVVSRGPELQVDDIPTVVQDAVRERLGELPDGDAPLPTGAPSTGADGTELRAGMTLQEAERILIGRTLEVAPTRAAAAEMLDIGERTLYRKIKEYGLQ